MTHLDDLMCVCYYVHREVFAWFGGIWRNIDGLDLDDIILLA
jgi:hypothetical protein